MFLKEFLDEFYYNELMNNYDYNYLCSLDYNNFKDVYNIFVKYRFDYIQDIILKYIELFDLEPNYIEECIIKYREKLGNDYVNIMGNDMRFFGLMLEEE